MTVLNINHLNDSIKIRFFPNDVQHMTTFIQNGDQN